MLFGHHCPSRFHFLQRKQRLEEKDGQETTGEVSRSPNAGEDSDGGVSDFNSDHVPYGEEECY